MSPGRHFTDTWGRYSQDQGVDGVTGNIGHPRVRFMAFDCRNHATVTDVGASESSTNVQLPVRIRRRPQHLQHAHGKDDPEMVRVCWGVILYSPSAPSSLQSGMDGNPFRAKLRTMPTSMGQEFSFPTVEGNVYSLYLAVAAHERRHHAPHHGTSAGMGGRALQDHGSTLAPSTGRLQCY